MTPHVLSAHPLVQQQNGVVGRHQLAEIGLSRHVVRSQVRARRWQVWGRSVVLHSGPLSREQELWAAVLSYGTAAVLAGLTAAESAGLAGWFRQEIHLLTTHGHREIGVPGVVLHTSRRLDAKDRHPVRTPPQTRLPRSLVDAASWMGNPRHACAVVAAGVQQRLASADQLREQLVNSGNVRNAHHLALALDDIRGGSHSLAEIDFFELCRRRGLPEPRRQTVRRDKHGRRRYLDVEFDGFVVEIDGALHQLLLTAVGDDWRQNELTLAGERVLRFSTVAVRLDEDRVVEQIRRAVIAFSGRAA